jgi:hypothetical protein
MRTIRWIVPIVIIVIGIALVGWGGMVLISTDEATKPAQDTQRRAEGPSPWEQYRDMTAEQAAASDNGGTVVEPQPVSYEEFDPEDMPQLMAGG